LITEERKIYYKEMIKKDRLMPIIVGNRFAGLITFYLTNDENKYDDVDPWGIFDDEPNGELVYISQMITDRRKDNKRLSFRALGSFVSYIKEKFPNVRYIFWRRWDKKKDIIRVYKKEL